MSMKACVKDKVTRRIFLMEFVSEEEMREWLEDGTHELMWCRRV
jgi:hypothetical protein